MNSNPYDEPTIEQAAQLVELLNVLSLFTRKTMLKWLPELLSELNITSERSMVMFELNIQPNISLKELAQSMLVSPSSMSVMINALVEQGIVTRIPDPEDRRKVVLRLSDVGQHEVQLTEQKLLERYREYLKGLPGLDRKELADSTTMMLTVVKRITQK